MQKRIIDVGVRVVDGDYWGEVGVVLFNHSTEDFTMKIGDHVTQIILQQIKTPMFQMTKVLDDTKRGARGFGSTRVQS